MSIELLSTFKVQAILDVYNHLNPEAPLKSWDKSKTVLVARIMAGNTSDAIEAAIKATESDTLPGKKPAPAKKKGKVAKAKKPAKAEKKAKGESKPRGEGIGTLVRALLKATPEASAAEILERLVKARPEAQTTAACVGWYRSKMYKSGELVK